MKWILCLWSLVSATPRTDSESRESLNIVTKQRNTLEDEFSLTIIHTNDVHAHFLESDAKGSPCKEEGQCYGGVARRATAIEQLKQNAKHQNVLLLDAGDQSQGTPWYVVYEGSAASHFMSKIGYDAMAIGNHEFDNGVDSFYNHFIKNVTTDGQTKFPILSCNIDYSKEPVLPSGIIGCSHIVEFGNVKVGIIGYTTEETPFISDTGDLIFEDVVKVVQDESERLRKAGCHILIGVGHYGYEADMEMVPQSDLDVVIGGHSHTLLFDDDFDGLHESDDPDNVKGAYPTMIQNVHSRPVPICQAFEYGKYLGHIDIKFKLENQKYVIRAREDITGKPILLDSSIPEDPEILAELREWEKPVDKLTKEYIGETTINLDGDRSQVRRRETNLGNLVADAVAEDLKVDYVFMNGGGIRGSIPVGQIDYGNVLTVVPFGGTFDKVKLTGKTIWSVFEHAVRHYESADEPGEFLQVSGFQVEYDVSNPIDRRVVKLLGKNGENIKFEDEYLVGTSDFIANGGDKYEMIPTERLEYHKGNNDAEVIKNRIRELSPISDENAPCEGRITINGKTCGEESLDESSQLPVAPKVLLLISILYLNLI